MLPDPAVDRLLGNMDKFNRLVPKVRYNNKTIRINILYHKQYLFLQKCTVQKQVLPELKDFLKILGLEAFQEDFEKKLMITR